MTVAIKFDANQDYQNEAIDAVCSLFKGWVQLSGSNGAESPDLEDSDALITESLIANVWGISETELRKNALDIQSRHRQNDFGEMVPVIPEGSKLSAHSNDDLRDFSVEMETGTGKTYVYLRTAIELSRQYGLKKFIVVVPSVAIREGVLSSLEMLKKHFRDLYSGIQYDSYAYESKNLTRLRQFATSNHLQILVMNIQAFGKDSNIIMRTSENGMRPVDFITSVSPIVIMDEPQKLDGKTQREAIANLNPLFRLRYSATHKETHCLVYRLGPVDAYDRRLVKRIEVLSMTADEDLNTPYVELKKVNSSGGAITATVLLNGQEKRVQKTLRLNDKLSEIAGSTVYEGWTVEQIAPSANGEPGYIEFGNHRIIRESYNSDSDKDWWQRAQIEAAITRHFETELQLNLFESRGEIAKLKPLTLFFIDRVANFDPVDGKFKIWFDELYEQIRRMRPYRSLNLPAAKDAREGYFASSKGAAKDTNGDSADDISAYDKIMKNKEILLSPEEPVRFIFSHSALSEGWDNPNVFTICNLQDVKSEAKRRQQIGRGLRLPVMVNGERCRNSQVNILTVIASESFETFAAELQNEIAEQTGESFEGRIKPSRKPRVLKLKENYKDIPGFSELWATIAPKTKYRLEFDSRTLVQEASFRLKELGRTEPISMPKIVMRRARLEMAAGKNIEASAVSPAREIQYERAVKLPDVLGQLQALLPVSRSTIARVIRDSGRALEARVNPAQFIHQTNRSIKQALAATIVNHSGIRYERMQGAESAYLAELFDTKPIQGYSDNMVDVHKSIFDAVICDSDVERRFAKALDERPDIDLFIKLPDWFKIDTPVGSYNPDWAIVRTAEAGEKQVYLVRETKGTTDINALRFEGERWKVEFGKRHFEAINVDYKIASAANQLDFDIPFKILYDEE